MKLENNSNKRAEQLQPETNKKKSNINTENENLLSHHQDIVYPKARSSDHGCKYQIQK